MVEGQWFTPQEVADRLRLTVAAIYDRIAAGKIPAMNVGTPARPLWRISAADLDRWMADRMTDPEV